MVLTRSQRLAAEAETQREEARIAASEQALLELRQARIIALDGLVCGTPQSAPVSRVLSPRFASGALQPVVLTGEVAPPGAYIRHYLAYLLPSPR